MPNKSGMPCGDVSATALPQNPRRTVYPLGPDCCVSPSLESSVAQADWSYFDDHFTLYAQAEYVETENEYISPFVYVDEESGWLIVWASDVDETPSI